MSNKSKMTKNHIIDEALRLFAEKGYQAVTMKDICERSGLSRGGVYRYFSSTKELFLAMLDRGITDDIANVDRAIANQVPALVILNHYMNNEKTIMFGENRGLYYATHEFAFVEPDQREYFDNRVKTSVELIARLLRYGQGTHEFKHFNSSAMAMHIIYFFDAMKTSASVLTITEEMVNQQMEIIREMMI